MLWLCFNQQHLIDDCDENFWNYSLFDWHKKNALSLSHTFETVCIFASSLPLMVSSRWRIWNADARFFSQSCDRCIQQISDFSCTIPASDPPTRVALLSGPARNPKESFIDEIVNTADRRMFCLSRPDVYPSRSATTRCASSSFPRSKKRLDFVNDSLSLFLTAHLNELALSTLSALKIYA